jgi:hypothetical protein
MTDRSNRPRNLDEVKLSPGARADLARLAEIKEQLGDLTMVAELLREEQVKIWRRRVKRDDVRQSELAEVSGVTQPYVARKVAKT